MKVEEKTQFWLGNERGFKVYMLKNTVNGKIYIGATIKPLKTRMNEHRHSAKKKTSRLYKCMREEGIDKFKISLLRYCETESDMHELEIRLISLFNSTDAEFGYNISTGGKYSSKGKKLSPTQKAAISEFQKKRKRKPFSKETLEKMRKSAGPGPSREAILKSASKNRGQPAKNRKSVLQYTLSGEFVARHESCLAAAKSVGGVGCGIYFISTGRLKTYKGFKWVVEEKTT